MTGIWKKSSTISPPAQARAVHTVKAITYHTDNVKNLS